MNEITKKPESVPGIRIEQFYTWKGVIPKELLVFIDKINLALDLPPLDEEQVLLLARFIMYEFATLTIQEVEDAIFKAKSGKLDCNPADYNKLSIDFMGRILSAYKEYKAKHKLIVDKTIQDKAPKQLPYSTYEGESAYEFIKGIYEGGKEPFIANWSMAFKYMEEKGILKYNNEEKEEFKQKFILEIQSEIKDRRRNNKNYSDLAKTLENDNYLKYECRKRIIKLYFESQT